MTRKRDVVVVQIIYYFKAIKNVTGTRIHENHRSIKEKQLKRKELYAGSGRSFSKHLGPNKPSHGLKNSKDGHLSTSVGEKKKERVEFFG